MGYFIVGAYFIIIAWLAYLTYRIITLEKAFIAHQKLRHRVRKPKKEESCTGQ